MHLGLRNVGRRGVKRHAPALLAMLTLAALALLSLLSGCGGSSTTTASINTGNPSGGTTGTVSTNGALPSLPLDAAAPAPSRGASDTTPPPPQQFTVLGSAFLQEWSGQVQDTSLLLDPAIANGPLHFAWGLYQVAGLAGQRPDALDVQGLPGNPTQQYFVAVANYTRGVWQMFGPNSLPDFEVDLSGQHDRYVSRAGNLYFLVIAHGANTVLVSQSVLTTSPAGPGDRPGLPITLHASKGDFADHVELTWQAGEGTANFEVFRADPPTDPSIPPNWQSLGLAPGSPFEDATVTPNQSYAYRVRAVNAAGDSAFSNVDMGFAGTPPPPPPQGSLAGRVVGPDGNPLGGVTVGLAGVPPPPADPTMPPPPPPGDFHFTATGPDGFFHFDGLPVGTYLLMPLNPALDFTPRFVIAQVYPGYPPVAMLQFTASPGQLHNALWGFAWTMGGPDAPGYHPLPGAHVVVHHPDGTPAGEAQADQNGFWVIGGLPPGDYPVTCDGPGWNFIPSPRPGHVDGAHMPPPTNFFGQPAPPPG